jgi:hypothetical protein
LNGQIQYGSARRLTLQPTRMARRSPTADPRRFPPRPGVSRPLALVLGTSLLLGALLVAAPREIPGVAAAIVLGGAWLSLVLSMTLPSESERAGQELLRRLADFRDVLTALGDAPSRAEIEHAMRRAQELGLGDAEIGDELAELRACADALDVKARLARGELPAVDPPDPLPAGDTCHYVCPVRFGRRRSDQCGKLVLTRGWLKFRGALDVSVSWSEVASVRRDGRDIVIQLRDSRRVLRFSCHSALEAAHGGVIAEYLAEPAHADTSAPMSQDL